MSGGQAAARMSTCFAGMITRTLPPPHASLSPLRASEWVVEEGLLSRMLLRSAGRCLSTGSRAALEGGSPLQLVSCVCAQGESRG